MLTRHAMRRCSQRGVRLKDIDMAIFWGLKYRQIEGRIVYFIGNKSVIRAQRQGEDIRDLKGLVVILSRDSIVITVIKVSHLHKIKRILK